DPGSRHPRGRCSTLAAPPNLARGAGPQASHRGRHGAGLYPRRSTPGRHARGRSRGRPGPARQALGSSLGRTLAAVYSRRRALGLSDGRSAWDVLAPPLRGDRRRPGTGAAPGRQERRKLLPRRRGAVTMPAAGTPRLLGTYASPAFDYGDVVFCARRGDVRIVALSDAGAGPRPTVLGQPQLPAGAVAA